METMPASALVMGDFERNHTIRFRVVESVRFLPFNEQTVLQETIVLENVFSLNIPFPFPFLLRPVTLSLHIESELWGMRLGDSLTELSNIISSYVVNLAHTHIGGGTMSIDVDVHMVTDVRIDGVEVVHIRPHFWVTGQLRDVVEILDDIHGSRLTPPSRNRGGSLTTELMDGVGIVDDIHGSDSTPPSRNRGALGYVINRLKTKNQFNGENIQNGEVDETSMLSSFPLYMYLHLVGEGGRLSDLSS